MSTHPTVRDLVAEYLDTQNTSYTALANRAHVSKATIGDIMTRTAPKHYTESMIQRLADGMSLPYDVVQQAALRSEGLEPPESPTDDTRADALVIAHRLEHLTDDELRVVRVLVQSLTDPRVR